MAGLERTRRCCPIVVRNGRVSSFSVLVSSSSESSGFRGVASPLLGCSSGVRHLLTVDADARPDLFVLGTVSRGGIPGFLIGNTAETVLSLVKSGVITVKPQGFQSPVTLEHGLSAAA